MKEKEDTVKTYIISRYSYDELNEDAKKVALKKAQDELYEFIPEDFISEPMQELLREEFGEEGRTLRLEYSLSYSQGDGVRFTGQISRKDAPEWKWPKDADFVDIRSADNRYSHPYTVSYEFHDKDGEWLDDADSVEFRKDYVDLCRKLERIGYRQIEDWASEDSALNFLKDAGERFDEYGKYSFPLDAEEIGK